MLDLPWQAQVPISADALRMRTRRLCERKSSGKCQVPDAINQDYYAGGEKREILEIALLQCLARHGCERKVYKKVRAAWLASVFTCTYIYIYLLYIYNLLYMDIFEPQGLVKSTPFCLLTPTMSCLLRVNSWQRSQSSRSKWPLVKTRFTAVGWRKREWGNPLTLVVPP